MVQFPAKGWSPPDHVLLQNFNLLRIAKLDVRFCLISGSESFAFQVLTALPAHQRFICSLDLDQNHIMGVSLQGFGGLGQMI
jgi:hypothetical protein